MKKFDWKPVKDFAGLLGEFVSYGVLLGVAYKAMDFVTEIPTSTIVRYDDAVGAIMDSSMWSSDKVKAINALKRHGDSEFYKAIIHIAKDGNMYSSDKVSMIESLSQ